MTKACVLSPAVCEKNVVCVCIAGANRDSKHIHLSLALVTVAGSEKGCHGGHAIENNCACWVHE